MLLLLAVSMLPQMLSMYGMSYELAEDAGAYRRSGVRSVREADVSRVPYGMLSDMCCVLMLARRTAPGVLCFRVSVLGRKDEKRRRMEGCSVGLGWGETEEEASLAFGGDGRVDVFRDSSFTMDAAMGRSSLWSAGEQLSSSFSVPMISFWFSFARFPSCWHSAAL